MTQLTLYSRTYCHLCSDMEQALRSLIPEFGALVRVIDIDAEPELEERFGELVPVLMAGEVELCHYFLDVDRVRAYLRIDRASTEGVNIERASGLDPRKMG